MELENFDEKARAYVQPPLEEENIQESNETSEEESQIVKNEHLIIKSRIKPYNLIQMDIEVEAQMLEEFRKAKVDDVIPKN